MLVTPLLIAATPSRGVDPRDIVLIDGRRYYFSTIEVSVPEAVSVCQEINMTVAGLETIEEFTAVTNYMKTNLNFGTWWWVSGCRQYTSWIWSNSGQLFAFFQWGPFRPLYSDSHAQVCLALYDTTGDMGDGRCDENNFFICEERSC
ncbi:hypothetical protein B566_EDAN010157 [Ephemera danica]|nr:hypothetical protein B566_EDAN010157 [Ephemera danica]